jgi:hypothetical protein
MTEDTLENSQQQNSCSFWHNLGVFIMAFSFGITFAYVESAVVVYLREIFYPNGFNFPLNLVICKIGAIELGREAMTIIMLITVSFIAGKSRYQRWSYFLFLFGVWDIFYYVWLKVFLNWPDSLFTWDILFFLPVPWTSPVLAVVSVACIITFVGIAGIFLEYAGYKLQPHWYHWIFAIFGSLVIYHSFTIDWKWIANNGLPRDYPWWLLFIGDYILFGVSVHILHQSLQGIEQTNN